MRASCNVVLTLTAINDCIDRVNVQYCDCRDDAMTTTRVMIMNNDDTNNANVETSNDTTNVDTNTTTKRARARNTSNTKRARTSHKNVDANATFSIAQLSRELNIDAKRLRARNRAMQLKRDARAMKCIDVNDHNKRHVFRERDRDVIVAMLTSRT